MSDTVKLTGSERVFYLILGVLLSCVVVCTLYPIVYVISCSISDPVAVAQGQVTLLPSGFSLEGYKLVLQNRKIVSGYYNSFIYTLFGTCMNLVITLLTAYVLSRPELIGKKCINLLFAFTMWFSGGLIPTFLLVKSLGMINTRWALWLPGLLNVYNMIVTRTYIANTIPRDLWEAASIDGCDYFRFFGRIVLPLSGAIIAVMALFYGITHWNAYFNALIYIVDDKLYPLQIVLRDILIASQLTAEDLGADSGTSAAQYGLSELLKYALIVCACLPLWIAYPFIQKYFVKGVMIGSIKG
jgi:putative aldouronate transport system permease protein